MDDTRNLIDEYKGMTNEQVFDELSKKRNELEIAIENVSHDFNVGTIVRSANSFNASRVHIIGRKKYNRRGAMCTDKYLKIVHWESYQDFMQDQREREREVVAIENNTPRAKCLGEKKFVQPVYTRDGSCKRPLVGRGFTWYMPNGKAS